MPSFSWGSGWPHLASKASWSQGSLRYPTSAQHAGAVGTIQHGNNDPLDAGKLRVEQFAQFVADEFSQPAGRALVENLFRLSMTDQLRRS